jgi:hypothetical protein
MLVEALHAHRPRNLKESNSKKGRPSIRLNYAIWRNVYSEGILFGLVRKQSAVPASSVSPMMLSKMSTDCRLCCPSITFQTCLIRLLWTSQ